MPKGQSFPGAIKKNNYYGAILRAVANYYHIPDNVRVRDLPENKYKILLHGEDYPDYIPVKIHSITGSVWRFDLEWRGIIEFLHDRYFKTESDAVRENIEKYMSHKPCSTCGGSRYKPEVLLVTVGGLPPHQFVSFLAEEKLFILNSFCF